MAQTITPVVYGGRGRWLGALGLHVVGATLTATVFGATLGGLGGLLGAPFGRPGALALGAVALVYVAGTFPRVQVPTLAARRQVPDWWRTFFSPPVTAFLYGAGLGIGFFTYLATGALAVASLAALLGGEPWLGVALVAPFGLARGLSAVVAAGVVTDEDGRELVGRLASHRERPRVLAARVSLAVVAVLAVAVAVEAGPGGWPSFASATLGFVFGWAAAAKIVGWRRWRRTLEDHALPHWLRDLAAWAVPTAEASVVLLTVLGERRAAAALALALLAGFTVEVARIRAHLGRAVPCGCFGGRRTADVRTMVARNAGLAALAVVAFAGAVDAAVLTWPGRPGPGEFLPMVLATGAIAVAVFAAWQATRWLGGSDA
jgi:hypothetical protein